MAKRKTEKELENEELRNKLQKLEEKEEKTKDITSNHKAKGCNNC